jgi:small-conductance mechanosensitive channel
MPTIDTIKEWLQVNWVLGPVVFFLWCVVLLLIKAVIFRKLRKAAARTTTSFDNILLNALNTPLTIVIVFVGFSLVWKVLPMNETFEYYMFLLTTIVIIVTVIIFIDRLIVGMLREHDRTSTTVKLSHGILQGLIRVIIFIIGALILLESLNINITPLIASLGIGTLAIALALQSTLANFFSGLFVMMDKSVNVGDFVQLESGEMGYVDDIGWRASRIRLLTNNHVIIPNAKLVDSVVTNFQAPESKLYLLVTVGVHYDSDLEHVERIVMEVAHNVINEVEGGIKEEEPSVWFREFGDSSITFRVRVACRDYLSQFQIQHELVKRIHRRFNEEGIVIPFPLRTLDFQPKHIQMFRELAAGRDSGEGQEKK